MKELYFRNREDWRNWLAENATKVEGLWMQMYKKHTGTECISYVDAVEEALCFGWIDGKIKRINEDYYVQWYTPRRPGSRWSRYNVERVERLQKSGRMTEKGMKAFSETFEKPHLVYDSVRNEETEIPEELDSALRQNQIAYTNFLNFSPSARRIYIGWYKYAKREKTRIERIKKIVNFAEQNKRPGIM